MWSVRAGGGGELPEPDDDGRRRARADWGALAALALLGAAGLYRMIRLADAAKLRDCAMSGRRNCAPADAGSPSG